MNLPQNLNKIGNYRYRPSESIELAIADQSIYSSQNNVFDRSDVGNFYTDATYSDVVIDGGYTNEDVPITFTSARKKEEMLYSLEDCLGRFRPRSGINKLRYFSGKYTHHTNSDLATRPRYYAGHRDDKFKYWTSYRVEDNVERGIASKVIGGANYIDDASPFVVYDSAVPANRIVVKMQTNVGSTNLGPFATSAGQIEDPLFGDENKTTPVKWSIQYLKNNVWVDAVRFDSNSTRRNGSPIIGSDGYVELQYGVIIPESYRDNFFFVGEIASSSILPSSGTGGETYYVKQYGQSTGTFYIWSDESAQFEQFAPLFGWQLVEDSGLSDLDNFVTELVNPPTYYNQYTGTTEPTEFQYISGLRVVVDTMNKYDSVFDLIELSPRLKADLSARTQSFSINKAASDLGVSGLPVGQLLASTGTLEVFDYDLAFSPVNDNSIVKDFLTQNLQIKFYDVIKDDSLYNYYVPLKTLYVEGMPETSIDSRSLSIELRDLYFYFESLSAPELLIPDTSLSYAISTILDYVGFSNYTIKTISGQPEPIIPYFFVDSDQSLAQVLESLAVSTQSAMFFDEYNNFVVMTKEYLMASEDERAADVVFLGSADSVNQGIYSNLPTGSKANIIEISSKDNNIFNDGTIRYTSRYIQKDVKTTQQSYRLLRDVNWVYKKATLWEISPSEAARSENNETPRSVDYSLGAYPINSDLSEVPPYVINNTLYNNTIDIGEAIYYLQRYSGYLYANAEIIKFDAVEYNIPGLVDSESGNGNVWISSTREYQNYFSKIPFNGKMYPTGLLRIYTEPEYETIDNNLRMKSGTVARHGRGQFGTAITAHSAGLDSYWSDNANVRGCKMDSRYIFEHVKPESETNPGDAPIYATAAEEITSDTLSMITDDGRTLAVGPAGIDNSVGINSSRNGIIKNFLASNFPKDVDVNKLYATSTGTVQASALVMTGGTFLSTENPLNYISYVYKPLSNSFKHFGTRMRLVGKIENNEVRTQTPYGSMPAYTGVNGSSAGLACMINPETNNGYYLELIALDTINPTDANSNSSLYNVAFYKIMQDTATQEAVPVLLWGTLANIVVDSGDFVGQYRVMAEENPTVYDIAVEYEDFGSARRFYIYMDNTLIQIVDDADPLPVYNNMALFVRGSSKAMFENIYALGSNYAQNTSAVLDLPAQKAFGSEGFKSNDALKKYAMSGVIQSTMLSGITPSEEPHYNLYFDEFGTIMREAAYFDVRYEKAYPAIYARMSTNFNRIKSYVVSGFMAGAYGAEFLVFNSTDTTIILDSSSENSLAIEGVAFTQKSDNELTMDDYYLERGNLSDPVRTNGEVVISPLTVKQEYNLVKNSRTLYGKKEFTIDAPYLQSQDDANSMMEWLVSKVTKPRLSVGVKIFPNTTIQLGDIVTIDYKDSFSNDLAIDSEKRFTVYNIEYSRSVDGPEMTVYLSEVV